MVGTEFNFKFYFKTNNEQTKEELQRLSHHIDFLVDLDDSEVDLTFWRVKVKEENEFMVVSGIVETSEEVDLEDLRDSFYYLIIVDDYEDLELYNVEVGGIE